MKIGLIDQKNGILRSGLKELIRFEISPDNLSFNKLLFSSFATPARYVMEIFLRLSFRIASEKMEECFIFNPFFSFSSDAVDKIVQNIKKFSNSKLITVIGDENGIPIGYLFPKVIYQDDAKYLSLLSTMDANLDAAFLKNIFLTPTEVIFFKDICLNKYATNNRFKYNEHFERLYRWITESSISTLCNQMGQPKLEVLTTDKIIRLKLVRDSIPFTAIMPYHAGDVLFLAIALKESGSYVRKMIISNWYGDIPQECAPDIASLAIAITPTMRNNVSKSDEVFFWALVGLIPEEDLRSSFYYFFRPCANNWKTNFHLIDQFAFASGSTFIKKKKLLSSRLTVNHYSPERNVGRHKILFHFEGGWPLKQYPQQFQSLMIDLFHSKGYEIIVLASHMSDSDKYKVVKYDNLSSYRKLLLSQHLIIGLDSFPVHYAAYVIGLPAICIYGNVKPSVSKARLSNHYTFLTRGMECANCGAVDKCPINGKNECDNFPKPEQIFITAEKMLSNLYAQRRLK